jgi:hypothetical protein
MNGSRACRFGFALTLAVIVAGSLVPEGALDLDLTGIDKIVHLAAWFGLALLASLGWPRWRGLALVGLPLVGLGLEVAQQGAGRDFDWLDALANAAGIGLAVALSAVISRRLER